MKRVILILTLVLTCVVWSAPQALAGQGSGTKGVVPPKDDDVALVLGAADDDDVNPPGGEGDPDDYWGGNGSPQSVSAADDPDPDWLESLWRLLLKLHQCP